MTEGAGTARPSRLFRAMSLFSGIDWRELFVPSMNPLELVLRGSLLYLTILVLMRVFRREPGALNTGDFLIVILIADAAQNAMAGEYHSITEGLVLVGTIVGWSVLLDNLAYRSRMVYGLLHPAPLLLIANGRVQRRNLRAELMTMGELEAQLREHGIEEVGKVKRAHLEPDGRLSVIRYDPEKDESPPEKARS